MIRTLRREEGHSVLELALVTALLTIALVVATTVMRTSVTTSRFAERESASINDARNALHRVTRDIRGANLVATSCEVADPPAGYCLKVATYLGDGAGFAWVKYRVVGTSLFRDTCESQWTACAGSVTMLSALANRTRSPAVPTFSCDTSRPATLIRVDLIVSPLSASTGVIDLQSSGRPRNTTTRSC